MTTQDDYTNEHGLVNAKLADINAENSPLWSVEHLELDYDETLAENLHNFIMDCRTDVKGLFHQSPETFETHDKYTSPDQLLAFICYFHTHDLQEENKLIWKYLIRHFFTYDNVSKGTNFDRTMQPGVICAAGIAAGSILSPFLKLVLFFVCLHSCWDDQRKRETSGSLKAWVAFKTFEMRKTERDCNDIIAEGPWLDWKGVFCEYFKEQFSPNRVAALRVLPNGFGEEELVA